MSRPRVEPGGVGELGVLNWLLCKAIARGAGVREANLFAVLGRQRRLFRAWLWFSARLMPGGSLSRHETELVILRVAHLRGCRYETDHHVRLGRRVGIDGDVLARIALGPAAAGWSDRHRALVAAVDALVATRNLDDATFGALEIHLAPPQLVELCLLVGQYEMLATTIATLGIERDVPRAP